ncbi:TonB-dependent receptor [Thermoflexibacter ruber]|uniref:Hemoglobin/transferrin/lactoferrin receptor protein n=1 Tax=Thermoflexibacter ruber TaxID=1003 RepID=A0A1I2JVI5_9BACT|nr:TonB-dependent receptor [Thermoflexibacter ruber]SFF57087.1 hemoglobin/transferrin/lactoferrin receptor protein [Thermoflexibacter ruber]
MKKYLYKKLFFVLLCLCPLTLLGQTLVVKDKNTDLPVENVLIQNHASSKVVMSNSKGQADISAFREVEKIEIRRLGYKTEVVSYSTLEQAGFVVLLTEANVSLDQVVIAATRWSQSKLDVPSRIISVSATDIALQNPQTTADLLGVSGEVFVQKSQQGGGSPMIRGFATNRLLYSVDGVRMNTAIFRSGNIQNVISLDPFAMENVQVLFGTGSIIYGSDALGGVMSFQTLTPQFSTEKKPLTTGKAVMRYSSANNEKTGHFDLNIGWRKWALVSSFSSNDFGDLRMGTNGQKEYLRTNYVQRQGNTDVVITNEDPLVQKPSGYKQINLMQKIRFRPTEKWDFQYAFHYSATTSYSRYDRLLRLRSGQPRSAEWNYGPQIWMMNHLNITHYGDNKLYDQMSIRLAGQFLEESRIERDLNRPTRFIKVEKVKAYSANFDFVKTVDKHKFFYGAEAVINDVESFGTDENITNNTMVLGASRYPNAQWSSYAAYLNYQFRASEKLLLQGGGRYNQFGIEADFTNNLPFYPFPFSKANLSNGALTGSLGLVYNPSPEWSIHLNGATGFRSPNVDDIGKVFDSQPGSVVVPNPDLKAEYAYNAEIGIAKVLGEVVKIDVTAYYTLLNNALVRRNFTLNGQDSIVYNNTKSRVQAIQNAAKASVYGVQASLEIKTSSGFGFFSQFNYQKGEEELDNESTSPLRHAAPWFGITRLSYTIPKLNVQFYAMYSGEVSYENLSAEGRANDFIFAIDANGRPYSPSWLTLNFKTLYQLNENLSLSAGIENLTDLRYRPYSSGIVAPGRNFILALRANF